MDLFSKTVLGMADPTKPQSVESNQHQSAPKELTSSFEEKLASGASKASQALAASASRELSARDSDVGKGCSLDRTQDPLIARSDITVGAQGTPPQLQGTTVAHLTTEKPEKARQTLAVNKHYIAYGLQQFHIRVIHHTTGLRSLLKHHQTHIEDLRFLDQESHVLASLDESHMIAIWRFTCDGNEGKIDSQKLLSYHLPIPAGVSAYISWIPDGGGIFAAGGSELHATRDLPLANQSGDDCQWSHFPLARDADVACVAIAPDGTLTTGSATGKICCISHEGQSYSPQREELRSKTSYLKYLTNALLLVGCANNTVFYILAMSEGESRSEPRDVVKLVGKPVAEMQGIAHYAPSSKLLLVANLVGSLLVVISLSDSLEKFSVVTLFDVTAPTYSMDIAEEIEEEGQSIVKIYTQSKEIRSLSLHAEHCKLRKTGSSTLTKSAATPSSSLDDSFAESGRGYSGDSSRQQIAGGGQSQPSRIPFSGSKPPSAPLSVNPRSVPQIPGLNQQSQLASGTPAQAPPQTTGPMLLPELSKKPESLSGIALLRKLQPAPMPAVASASRLAPTSTLLAASQTSLPRVPSGASSVLTETDGLNGERPSSAARSVESQAAESLHAEDLLQPSASAIPGDPVFREGSSESANREDISPAPSPDSISSTTAVVNLNVKQQPVRTSSDTSAAQKAGLPETVHFNGPKNPPRSAAADVRGKQKPPVSSAAASSEQVQGGGKEAGQNGGRETSLAVLERMQQGVLRRIKQEMQASQANQQQALQSTAKDLKDQLEANAAAQERREAAQDRKMEQLFERQEQMILAALDKRERSYREILSKLMTVISDKMRDELPHNLAKALAPKLDGLASTTSVAVQNAVRTALPKDLLTGNMRASLESALASQLSVALAAPLQQSFQHSFQQNVMPAFEAATQSMFAQVQSTFAGGLAEHLQAAGGVNADIAARLQEATQDAKEASNLLAQQVSTSMKAFTDLANKAIAQRQEMPYQGQGQSAELTMQRQIEATMAEAKQLVANQKYAEAFNVVLNLAHVATVVWLCNFVNSNTVLRNGLLSQTTLLVLLSQLSHDILVDTRLKLLWIKEIAEELEPRDHELAQHQQELQDVITNTMTTLQSNPLQGHNAKIAGHAVAVLQHVLHQIQTGHYI